MLLGVLLGVLLLSAPAPEPREQRARYACVVRVEVAAATPSYIQPWQVGAQEHRRGSGFQISGQRILTNHHVIEDGVDIRVSRGGEAKRWPARVVTAAPDVDLAILEIVDADGFFADGGSPAELSTELPALQASVSVLGFPSGGRTICVTEGIVSRVDVKNYRLGYTASLAGGDHLVIQIDAAINGGNSGGPCFGADGKVVGVAFQGIDAAQNVGYVIPSRVVRTFLDNVERAEGVYGGVQEVPYRHQNLESPALREKLGVPDNTSGVAITAVSSISTVGRNSTQRLDGEGDGDAGPLLRVDDVVVAIDGHRLGNDHTVALRGGEIVRADYLITSKAAAVPTTFDVLRNGHALRFSSVLTPLPPPIPRNHGFDSTPEWLLIGGLIFTPLTAALVDSASANGMSTSVHDVYQLAVHHHNFGFRSALGTDTVVLLDILAHDANFGYAHDGWRVLEYLNGVRVTSLAQLHALWHAAASAPETTKFLEFRFHDHARYVLRTSAAVEAEAMLLARHGIPAAASPGLVRGDKHGRVVGGGGGRPRRARTLRLAASSLEGGASPRRGRNSIAGNESVAATAESRSRAKRARTSRAWSEKRAAPRGGTGGAVNA